MYSLPNPRNKTSYSLLFVVDGKNAGEFVQVRIWLFAFDQAGQFEQIRCGSEGHCERSGKFSLQIGLSIQIGRRDRAATVHVTGAKQQQITGYLFFVVYLNYIAYTNVSGPYLDQFIFAGYQWQQSVIGLYVRFMAKPVFVALLDRSDDHYERQRYQTGGRTDRTIDKGLRKFDYKKC